MADQPNELRQRLEFAVAASREAGDFVMKHFQSAGLVVERKTDESPVTVADRGAEELLRRQIGRFFPADGVFGEEFSEKPSKSGYRWILDPIDGTQSFIRGVPLFGTLVGLEFDHRCVMGVCRLPALDEVVYAGLGIGCWWQQGGETPRQAKASSVASLDEAIFCFTEVEGFAVTDRMSAFERLCKSVPLARGWSDCYGHVLVATGRADVMVDPRMNAWDAAALLPIVHEAGGRFFDWKGTATIYGGDGVSTNALLKDAVRELLADDQDR